MKRVLISLLALTMALSFAACGGDAATTNEGESLGASEENGAAIRSVDDLEGKTIGVQQSTTGDIYAADIEGAKVERYPKGMEAVMALKQGKIDAVIIDDQPAKVFASMYDDIEVLEEPFTVEDYAICVAKENTELTEQMNQAIAELKEDGTLQAILDYYIGQVEGSSPYESPEGIEYPNGKLTMATNAEFPPYEYWENERVRGVDADFARAICDKLGYDLEIDDMNFNSIIPAVQSGKADFGAAGMTMTEERLKSIDFTDSYCTASQVIIVKK